MSLAEIRTKNLRWINIVNPEKGEIDFLRNNFPFHPLDLEDCLIYGQRPKIEKYPKYIFLVLLFPVYNRKTREIEPSEIDFFIGEDYFVTVHNNNLAPLRGLFQSCQTEEKVKYEILSEGSVFLLYQILDKLLCYCYPMLDHVSLDIRSIEREIFSGSEKKMVSEILIIRRNITDFRQIMQAHKNTLKKLSIIIKDTGFSRNQKMSIYYNDLIELSKEIWDHLESFKESIEALHETNESLISNRLNDIMKTFTSISVIIFILTLIASIFAINAKDTPFLHFRWGFWIILVVLLFATLVSWQFFKKKKFL
ncbi:MAG: magnesium transporter CorA family protein [Patescibacteria group bacterium]